MGRIWDKQKVIESAKLFKNKSEWRKKFPSAYAYAFNRNLLDEACSHMPKRAAKLIYSNEEIINDAKKFKTRKEWIENSRSKYFLAINRGILKICCEHMGKRFLKKDFNQIKEIAKKYNSKGEWLNADENSYRSAMKRGWLEEVTSHMKRVGQTSIPEQKLLLEIKKIYPSAKAEWFKNEEKEAKQKRFQIDIYIPEIKKGIEFNGTYWHSLEGLKRGRPTWTDEELLKYEEIKKIFFKNKNIDLMYVKQKDWENCPDKVLEEVKNFLGTGDLNV